MKNSYQQRYVKEQQRFFEMGDCFNRCLENENYTDAELILQRIIKQNEIVKELQLILTITKQQ